MLSYRFQLMPQFWIAVFFIMLAIAQLFQSVKEIALPLPAYLVLGALLAVASNYQPKISPTAAQNSLPATNVAEPISPAPSVPALGEANPAPASDAASDKHC